MNVKTPTTEELNLFGELLAVLSDEELIRLRRRFEMRNQERMVGILTDEIQERNAALL